jgi:hypothetical protein
MTASRTPQDFIAAAMELLQHARADHDVQLAVQSLAEIGRGAASHGFDLSEPALADFRAALLALADEPEARQLFAWAVLTVTNAIYSDRPSALAESLYARSGFQLLLDIGVWDEVPFDRKHLDDVDTDLAEAVGDGKLDAADRPRDVPPSHSWWLPPTEATPSPQAGS